MYEFTSKVRYSEITPDGCMTLAALTTRMQDCSVFHSEAIGRGPECWLKEDAGWIPLYSRLRYYVTSERLEGIQASWNGSVKNKYREMSVVGP